MTPECFDALKQPIPCVVRVPEPAAWEIAVVGIVLVLVWWWGKR